MKIDIRTLYESTDLPRLWEIFLSIINIGGASQFGYNLSGFSTFSLGLVDLEVEIDHGTFWSIMFKFLNEVNTDFSRRSKRKGT